MYYFFINTIKDNEPSNTRGNKLDKSARASSIEVKSFYVL